MKTRKTKFVAVLKQTLTTTSTLKTTYRARSAGSESDQDREAGKTLTTITNPLAGFIQWCVECVTPIAMMSPEKASAVCFQSTRETYRLVEAGRVHFTDGPDGVMVCPASLMQVWAGNQGIKLLVPAPTILPQAR